MQKIIKIISILLILGLSFQNISFAVEEKTEDEQLLLQQEEDKKTKKHLQKKVIISKFILKKQLGTKKTDKYSKIMNKILSKYGENEEVLTKLETRLEKIGEKTLTAKTKALFNYINYNIKYKLLVYRTSPKRLAEIEEQKIMKQKALEEVVIVKKKRRSGGGGGGGGGGSNRTVAPIVVIEPEPIVNPEPVIEPITEPEPEIVNIFPVIENIKTINLSYDEIKTYQVNANDANGDELIYSLQNNPDFININSTGGIININPSEFDKGEYDFEVFVNDGNVSISSTIKIEVFGLLSEVASAINNAGFLTVQNVATPVTSVLADTEFTVPNKDGSWDYLRVFSEKYYGPNELIVFDSGTREQKVITIPGTDQNWHITSHVIAPNGKLYINVLGRNPLYRQIINIYDPDTNELTLNAIVLAPEIHGETHPMVLGTDGMIYMGGSYIEEGNNIRTATVLRIDTSNDTVTNYGRIGPDHSPNGVWGYTVGADETHVYVASGKIPWYLVAYKKSDILNDSIEDIKGTVLLQTANTGGDIKIEQRKYGIFVTAKGLNDGNQDGKYFLYNGEATFTTDFDNNPTWPYPQGEWGGRPGTIVELPPKPIFNSFWSKQPNSNDSKKTVLWYLPYDKIEQYKIDKDNGLSFEETTGREKYEFQIATYATNIARLKTMDDNRIYGLGKGYAGNFIYDPQINISQFKGKTNLSPYGIGKYDGKIVMSGYPSSLTYEYDTTKAWNYGIRNYQPGDEKKNLTESNPKNIGYLKEYSGAHRSYAVTITANKNVYVGGQWYRDGHGGGLAWYNNETGIKGGMSDIFSNYQVRDLTTAGDDNRYVVISTQGVKDITLGKTKPTKGKIFILDSHTNEIINTIEPTDIITTGYVLGIGGNFIVGLTNNDDITNNHADASETYIYKINVITGEIIYLKTINGRTSFKIAPYGTDKSDLFDVMLGPDGNIWTLFQYNRLAKITPEGYIKVYGRISTNNYGGGGSIAISGKDVYFGGEKSLRKVSEILK